MANFQDILSKTGTSAPPKPLPPGNYLCVVDGQPEIKKIGKNQTDCVDFSCKPMQAMQDVDQAALAEALNGRALSEKKITVRQFITEDAAWRLDQFFYHLGLIEKNAQGEFVLDKSRGELIPATMGRQVVVTMGLRPSDDGTTMFPDVKGTARV